MKEALYNTAFFRLFTELNLGDYRVPYKAAILCFRHLLEKRVLSARILSTINATQYARLAAQIWQSCGCHTHCRDDSTKNITDPHYPKMRAIPKAQQSYIVMQAYIGLDSESGLVHIMVGTPAKLHDVTKAHALLQEQETNVFSDASYNCIAQRELAKGLKVK